MDSRHPNGLRQTGGRVIVELYGFPHFLKPAPYREAVHAANDQKLRLQLCMFGIFNIQALLHFCRNWYNMATVCAATSLFYNLRNTGHMMC